MTPQEDFAEREERADWTPARGLLKGIVAGLVTAAILGVAADLFAWYAPLLALNIWLRGGASLLTMWLLFLVVHRAAGMTGPPCTAVVVVLVLLLAFSQHIVFALHGVESRMGRTAGWEWCSLTVLAVANVSTAGGIIFGVLLWHDGVSVRSLTDILTLRVWGSMK